MQTVHAALLLHSAGQKVTADAIKKVIKAAGGNVDDGLVNGLIASLDGVNIDEAIASAPMMMAAASPAAAPGAPAAAAASAAKEETPAKKSDEDLGLDSLFG